MTKDKKTKNTYDKKGKEKELETKLVDMENKWKRALADYDNQQKRFNIEKEEVRKLANELLILKILPVLDSMEMLLKHNDDEGFRMITKEMTRILEGSGLEEIRKESFDSTVMEAIDVAAGEDNKVIRIEQKGYLLNGKLIRPAKVVVGRKENQ